MVVNPSTLAIVLAMTAALFAAESRAAESTAAETRQFISVIEPKPIGEFWLNPGFYSYHFQKDLGLKNNNFGLGGEYRYSTVSAITLGIFENSDLETSRYVGWYWQPLRLGAVRLGAVVGVIDGYPKMLNGNWFVAAMPAASYEYKNIGINCLFISSYKDRLHGSISMQFKLKLP